MAGDEGYYLIPETIKVRAQVSLAGTRTPANPPVTLIAVSKAGVALDISGWTVAFTQQADGEFVLPIPTTDLVPGTYKYVVRVGDDPLEQTIIEDTFVLRTTASPLPVP